MSYDVPTVRIKSGDSYIVINHSDFDQSKHEMFVPIAATPVAPPPGDASPPQPTDALATLAPDWRDAMPTPEMRELANRLAGRMPDDRAQAIAVLMQHGAK